MTALPFAGLPGVVRLDNDAMRAGYDGKPIVFQDRSHSMVTLAEPIGLECGSLLGPGRNFSALLARIAGLSGAAMQGDGSIIPILDLISLYLHGGRKKRAAIRKELPNLKEPEKFGWLVGCDSDTRRGGARRRRLDY
jgi:hypothetical protein